MSEPFDGDLDARISELLDRAASLPEGSVEQACVEALIGRTFDELPALENAQRLSGQWMMLWSACGLMPKWPPSLAYRRGP